MLKFVTEDYSNLFNPPLLLLVSTDYSCAVAVTEMKGKFILLVVYIYFVHLYDWNILNYLVSVETIPMYYYFLLDASRYADTRDWAAILSNVCLHLKATSQKER